MGYFEDLGIKGMFGPWMKLWYPDSWVSWFFEPNLDSLIVLLIGGFVSSLFLRGTTEMLKEGRTPLKILLFLSSLFLVVWSLPGFLAALWTVLVVLIVLYLVFAMFFGAVSAPFRVVGTPIFMVIDGAKGLFYIFRD